MSTLICVGPATWPLVREMIERAYAETDLFMPDVVAWPSRKQVIALVDRGAVCELDDLVMIVEARVDLPVGGVELGQAGAGAERAEADEAERIAG